MTEQQWLLGGGGFLLIAVGVVMRMMWNARAPAHAFLNAYMGSQDGQEAVAKALRDYTSRLEGKLFIEGVINGKVRAELQVHNAARDAHHNLQQEYATVVQLNQALQAIRADHSVVAKATLDAVCHTLEQKFDELTKELRR